MGLTDGPIVQIFQDQNRPTTVENPNQGRPLGKPITSYLKPKKKPPEIDGKRSKATKKDTRLTIGCWNIRRGLLRREEEMKELLNKDKIDIMFLVETDTEMIVCQQITKHIESNNLLPNSQHGSREKRSTMTALSRFNGTG